MLLRALLLLLLLGSLSCAQKSGGDDDDSSEVGDGIEIGDPIVDDSSDADDEEDTNSERTLRVTTYNVGLLPGFVPFTDQRVLPVAQALAGDSSDVLCLQEVWRAEDLATIDQRISGRFPHSLRTEARQKFARTVPACTFGSLTPLAECIIGSCLSSSDDIVQCASEQCSSEVYTLAANEPICAAALFAQSGRDGTEFLQIQEELLGNTAAGLFAYNGESGTVLYSRLPLENAEVVDFFDISTTSRRVALFATVSKNGQQYRVGCTHLTSNLDGVLPYTGSFGSWGAETAAQAERMISTAQNSATEAVILAGDFNCSEANSQTGAGSDLASVCGQFRSAGYADPAAQQFRCTFCNDNELNQLKTGQGDQNDLVLDHIFYSGTNPRSSARLLFNESVSYAGTSAPLSDHFGVSVDF